MDLAPRLNRRFRAGHMMGHGDVAFLVFHYSWLFIVVFMVLDWPIIMVKSCFRDVMIMAMSCETLMIQMGGRTNRGPLLALSFWIIDRQGRIIKLIAEDYKRESIRGDYGAISRAYFWGILWLFACH